MKILIAYDGSECADAALTDLQRAGLPQQAEVHLLSVYAEWMPEATSFGMVDTGAARQVQEWEKGALAMVRRARTMLKAPFPEWEIYTETATGSPAGLILHRAEELKADLIVVGSHGRSAFGRLVLGSVSQKVLHGAHCIVRIARGRVEEPEVPIRLIIGIDGSRGAEATVNAVIARHWPAGTEARIVNGFPVLPAIGAEYAAAALAQWIAEEKARVSEMIEKAVEKLKGAGLIVSKVIKQEDGRQSLVSEAAAWGADCIFVGARGMGAIERFLVGSVSSFVATHAHCSVEVVRGDA